MTANPSYYHDKAEQDRSTGKDYDKPHGVVADLTTWTNQGMQDLATDNIAYDEGWKNTDSQIKGTN